MAKHLTIKEFFVKFPDDDTCLLHVIKLRYDWTRKCPNRKCGEPTEFHKLACRPAFSCKLSGHHVYTGARRPFERTRTPLESWFYGIYLFTTNRHGLPTKELQRELGVTYKTAWPIGHE